MSNAYLLEVLENYGVATVGVAFFLISLLLNRSLSREITTQFVRATLFTALLVVADALEDYYALLPHPTAQRMLCAAAGYSCRVLILYSVVSIFCRHHSRVYKTSILIPAVANILVSFSAFFSPKVFYYTADNQIVRGPLIAIPFIVSIFYGVLLIIEGAKVKHRGDHRELTIVVIVFAICTVTTLLEVKFRTAGILPGSAILSLPIYYMHFMSNLYKYDPLTDACMRSSLYEETSDYVFDYGVIELDLNDLKVINDTHGHLAGDKALVSVTKAVRNCLPSEAELYRIGGDEFVVIYKTNEEQNLMILADRMRSAIAKTQYSAALGFTMRTNLESLESALSRADADMYKNKAAMKDKVLHIAGKAQEHIG